MPRVLGDYYWHMEPGVVVGDYDCCYSFMRVSDDPTVTLSGVLPLTYTAKGQPLIDYTVYGNAAQAATPSHDNPAEVQAVGDKTGNLIKTVLFSTENWKFQNANTTVDVVDNKITINGSWFAYIVVPVTANTNYTFQYVCESYTKKDLAAIFGAKNGIMNNSDPIAPNAPTGKVFNSGNRTEVALLFYASDSSEVGISVYSNIQLELGSTATDYEPYGYKIPFTTAAEDGTESITTTVYLDKPLYKIGDYADTLCYAEQKVERAIKEMILTGEENITFHARFDTHISVRIPTTSSVLRSSHVFCTHLQYVDFRYLYSNGQYGVSAHDNSDVSNVYFSIHGLTDINSYTSWLKEQYNNGTPVKIYYVLQTPESESVELPKLPTLDGANFLNTDTTVRPSNVTITGKGLAEITDDPVMTDLLTIMEGMDE